MSYRQLPLWTPIGSLALALGWLLPNANPPWVAFQKDSYVAAVLLACAVPLAWRAYRADRVPRMDAIAATLLGLAVLTMAQWGMGIIHFAGHALVGASYWVGAAFALCLGHLWWRVDKQQFGDFLFGAFLVGALATVGMMLVQWAGLETGSVWLAEARNRRPFGNLIQPNNAATLLLLGMVSLVWLWTRALLSWRVGAIAGAYLIFGIAISGSRIAFLSLTLLSVFAVISGMRRSGWRRLGWFAALVLAIFMLLVWMLNSYSGSVTSIGDVRAHALGRDLAGGRLDAYAAFLDAAMHGPVLGFGFDQAASAQLAAQRLGHDLPTFFRWSHNAFLDLIIWYGPAVGSFVLLLVAWAVLRFLRAGVDRELACFAVGLFVVGMHAMVELPLAYGYFLFPSCLMIGALSARIALPSIALPKRSLLVSTVFLAVWLVVLAQDYLKVESSYYAWRFKQARIGTEHPHNVPETIVLDHFQALIHGVRGSAETLSTSETIAFREAVKLQPSPVALVHLAAIQVRKGWVAEAQDTADLANSIYGSPIGDAMRSRWTEMSSVEPALAQVIWSKAPPNGR